MLRLARLSPAHRLASRGTLPLVSTCAGHASQRCYASSSSVAAEAEINSSRNYCLNLVKKYDSPSYVLQTFIPAHVRDAYIALRAFNVDLANIADLTTNPTVGGMRMQFWRDAVKKAVAGRPPKEPVAIFLSYVAENLYNRTQGRQKMSLAWLNRVINTREKHLSNPPFPDLASVETYAENTYSTLLYLTLSTLPMSSITADHLASHIGKATGIATLLRGLPFIAFPDPRSQHTPAAPLGGSLGGPKQGSVLLPLDIMAEHGVREEDVLRTGPSAQGLKDAVFAVATRANDHLITAKTMLQQLNSEGDVGHEFEHQYDEGHGYTEDQKSQPAESQRREVEKAFGVLMPAVSTRLWLERLESADFDVFNSKLNRREWKLPFAAYLAFSRKAL